MSMPSSAPKRLHPERYAATPKLAPGHADGQRHSLTDVGLTRTETLRWLHAVAVEVAWVHEVRLAGPNPTAQLSIEIQGRVAPGSTAEAALRRDGRARYTIVVTEHLLTRSFAYVLFTLAHEVGHLLDAEGQLDLPGLDGLPGARRASLWTRLINPRRARDMDHRAYMHSRAEVRANAVAWLACAQLAPLTPGRFGLHRYALYLGSAADEFEALVGRFAHWHSVQLPWPTP